MESKTMDEAVRERLRAIKSLLLLEDEEALAAQRAKLSAGAAMGDGRVAALVEALRRNAHGEAIALVERLLAEDAPAPPVEAAEAPVHDALAEEVERLEARLAELEAEEDALQRTIRRFSVRYRDELGPLVSKLLRLRKERLEQSLYARRSSRTRRTAFNEADAQFARFQQVIEEAEDEEPPAEGLSDDDRERLKAAYRRASKRCHPDVVDPSMEDEARTYFNELRDAYQRNDLARVEAIADTLAESGFARQDSDAAPAERVRLEARAERLRRQIDEREAALEAMHASKAYEVVQSVSDLDGYFEALKRRLQREIRLLQQERRVQG